MPTRTFSSRSCSRRRARSSFSFFSSLIDWSLRCAVPPLAPMPPPRAIASSSSFFARASSSRFTSVHAASRARWTAFAALSTQDSRKTAALSFCKTCFRSKTPMSVARMRPSDFFFSSLARLTARAAAFFGCSMRGRPAAGSLTFRALLLAASLAAPMARRAFFWVRADGQRYM